MTGDSLTQAFGVLRQFGARSRRVERCELCGQEVASGHPHLIDPKGRSLLCACGACAVLFSGQAAAKYKRVPQDIRFLAGFRLTDALWESLMIPINMAFFFRSSPDGRIVALYPSPAGATESQLPLETWGELVEENPVLREMDSDVEGLLVNRLGPARGFSEPEYYLLPIDECYRLVGLIRARWRGLSGGTELWEELGRLFDELKQRAGAGSGMPYA